MIDERAFYERLGALALVLRPQQGTTEELQAAFKEYYRHLQGQKPGDLWEALDRIPFSEQWFPTIATILEYTRTCARDRIQKQRHEDQRREFIALGERHGLKDLCDVQAKLAPFRLPDGSIDMDALYRHSRELRGLDPDVDERLGHSRGAFGGIFESLATANAAARATANGGAE